MVTRPGTVRIDAGARLKESVTVDVEEPGFALYQVEIKRAQPPQDLQILFVVALSVPDACECVENLFKGTVTKVSVFQVIRAMAPAAVQLVRDLKKKADGD